ncbi:hypothetical protein [Kitasatospora sp. NPDC051914]|uniref:hypothetical protein n=1 Tax=Kitasatospora sp. NPDC051914 TaxID=3154945 RepID=UPI00343A4324
MATTGLPDRAPPAVPPGRTETRGGPVHAALTGAGAGLLVVLAITVGSRGLRGLDSDLVPYAVVTVVLAWVLAHRGADRIAAGAGRLLRWARHPSRPRLRLHRRPGPRPSPAGRLVIWGSAAAAAVALPLGWGWFAVGAVGTYGPGQRLRLHGRDVLGYTRDGLPGLLVRHWLDLAALVVLAGCAGLLQWRREGRDDPGRRSARDVVLLAAPAAVAATGLLLTASEVVLGGGGHRFLSVLHLVSLVAAVALLPYGGYRRILRGRARTAEERPAREAEVPSPW